MNEKMNMKMLMIGKFAYKAMHDKDEPVESNGSDASVVIDDELIQMLDSLEDGISGFALDSSMS